MSINMLLIWILVQTCGKTNLIKCSGSIYGYYSDNPSEGKRTSSWLVTPTLSAILIYRSRLKQVGWLSKVEYEHSTFDSGMFRVHFQGTHTHHGSPGIWPGNFILRGSHTPAGSPDRLTALLQASVLWLNQFSGWYEWQCYPSGRGWRRVRLRRLAH